MPAGVAGRAEIVAMTQHEPLAMPLEEAMRTQRAIRRLKDEPVDDALVLHILELAMKAPTGSVRTTSSAMISGNLKLPYSANRIRKINSTVSGPIT